jgi:uncharacterized membrane protein YphA (DoxX/SURF4 family)
MLMNGKGILILARIVIALTWFYQGIWLKVIARDPHHLEIVTRVGLPKPALALTMIGIGEGLLGLAVLLGVFPRLIACFQIAIILAMNLTAILASGGAIHEPAGLLIGNAPLLLCMAMVGFNRPKAASRP